MLMRKLLIGGLVAASLGSVALPAAARTYVDFYVNTPPPPVRYEYVPVARPGFVWVPGVWAWRHHRHVWVPGHWIRARHGYYYEAPRWVPRDAGRWGYYRGGWHRDADRDGVPDRYDRAPLNPYIR